jgi:hypothetical protein
MAKEKFKPTVYKTPTLSSTSKPAKKKPTKRDKFDDQSNVDKLYEWLYNTGKYSRTQYDIYND